METDQWLPWEMTKLKVWGEHGRGRRGGLSKDIKKLGDDEYAHCLVLTVHSIFISKLSSCSL